LLPLFRYFQALAMNRCGVTTGFELGRFIWCRAILSTGINPKYTCSSSSLTLSCNQLGSLTPWLAFTA